MHEKFHVIIPPDRYAQALETAKIINVKEDCSFLEGVKTVHNNDPSRNYIAMTWEPACTVIGINGLPSVQDAGNVLHPKLTLRINIRTPPTANAKEARDFAVKELSRDPPYNAKVKVICNKNG